MSERAFAVQWNGTVALVFAESAGRARAHCWRTLKGIYTECDGSWWAEIKVRRWPVFDGYVYPSLQRGRCFDPCIASGKDVVESPFGEVRADAY